ncbi:hypothetical protein KQX54_018825 [Cotesia glomerata]|uniref:S-protein homolog n=1 Tax=Cotesia glomerata TaxID=32391 RepID=A0AAV7HVD7_COTGL|nr:hypothetical protein KQX54_018825 [Cotesia glomerata]
MRRMLIQIDLVASPCRKSLSNGVVECIAAVTIGPHRSHNGFLFLFLTLVVLVVMLRVKLHVRTCKWLQAQPDTTFQSKDDSAYHENAWDIKILICNEGGLTNGLDFKFFKAVENAREFVVMCRCWKRFRKYPESARLGDFTVIYDNEPKN